MPITYTIYLPSRIVVTTASEVLTFAEARSHGDRLLSDPDFSDQFDQLVDLREVTDFRITNQQARELASRRVFSPTSRRAAIAPSDLAFGITRMMESYHESSGHPSKTCVFRELCAALNWLEREDLPLTALITEKSPAHKPASP